MYDSKVNNGTQNYTSYLYSLSTECTNLKLWMYFLQYSFSETVATTAKHLQKDFVPFNSNLPFTAS